jgi:hypothetical protein
MVRWSLDQAYGAYPQIEEEFSAALDVSLSPRSPALLFDLIAGLGLGAGAVAIDVGRLTVGHDGRAPVASRREPTPMACDVTGGS